MEPTKKNQLARFHSFFVVFALLRVHGLFIYVFPFQILVLIEMKIVLHGFGNVVTLS